MLTETEAVNTSQASEGHLSKKDSKLSRLVRNVETVRLILVGVGTW